MPTILLIRHGINNLVGKRLAGRLPGVRLNEAGWKQAERIAEALKSAPIQAIYSSPLERAMETAAPLAAALNLEVRPHPGLIEIDFGAWQGITFKQMRRMKLWKTVQENPAEMRFPQGESFVEAQQRLVETITEIAAQYGEKDWVACFSHSDAIKLAVAHFLAMPLNAFQRIGIDTASLSVIHLGKNEPFVAAVNQRINFEWPQEPPNQETKREPAHV